MKPAPRNDIGSDHISTPTWTFFLRYVNGANYLHMLQTWLIPQLEELSLMERMWLQHDGAPVHFALPVREFLNEHFLGWWIGRGSPATPALLKWPPRRLDLTTSDISLWGVIKAYVSARHYTTNKELCNSVQDAFHTITPDILRTMSRRKWRHIEMCIQRDGKHTDILDM